MKKNRFFSICLGLVSVIVLTGIMPFHVKAYYVQVNAKERVIPSFEVVGTVPLTQIGIGEGALVKVEREASKTLGDILNKFVPVDWKYYISENVDLNSSRVLKASKKISWPRALEKVAEGFGLRILVDWNYKSVLIASSTETSVDAVFIDPRQNAGDPAKLMLPQDSPMRKLEIRQYQQAGNN